MDFDTLLERRGTHSVKWDGMKAFLGRDDVIPMWVADMDFPSPEPVVKALERRAAFGVYGYVQRGEAFFESIQQWFARRHDWRIERSWIVPCPGVVPAMHSAIRALSRPGDGVVVQTPAYYPFFSAVTSHGRVLLESPLREEGGRYQMDFDDLARKLERARVLVLCNPHNPVGRVWRPDELATLAELCRRADVKVISDDIHCDIAFARYTPLLASQPGLAERTLTVCSPSKTFGLSSLHTAFVVAPDPALKKAFEAELHGTGYFWGNLFGDAALEAAYLEGAPWLEALLAYLGRNLRAIEDALRGHAGIRVVPTEGTYLSWLDFRGTGLSEEEVTRRLLEEAGVGLEKGSVFGAAGVGFQRLNFATPRALVDRALERILAAFKPWER
jgi:cystathionine beta-lyase